MTTDGMLTPAKATTEVAPRAGRYFIRISYHHNICSEDGLQGSESAPRTPNIIR